MGVMWHVWPLDDDMKEWLRSQEIAFPAAPSRLPTGIEIKRAIDALNVEVKVNDNGLGRAWQAMLGDQEEWANLIISNYSGDDEYQKFYFEKGHESLIRKLLVSLVSWCGPLILINDAGDPPEVVFD